MKRVMFYGLIVIQIIFVVVLVFQFERITTTGKEIEILTIKEYSNDDYTWEFNNSAYVEYEINKIPEERWDSEKENVSYNDKIYVLLNKSHDDVFKVKQASIKKLKATNDDEVVIVGRSDYGFNSNEPIRVNYDFNTINHIEQYGEFKSDQTLKVTLIVSTYGQYKITNIEAVE